jgi:hypothetical protein
MIDEGMARAEKVACAPGDHRCYPFPDPLERVRETCTPKGRCKLGFIVAKSGREAWDVWLNVTSGEGRLKRPLVDAVTPGADGRIPAVHSA